MKYAITEYFAEKGKRMTNVTKAKKDVLMSIIKKYNIDVDKYAIEVKEQEKQEKEQRKRDEEEREKRRIEYKKMKEKIKKNQEKVKKYLEEKKISLTHLQKRRINMKNLKQELYFKNNADKIKEGKIQREKDAINFGNKICGVGNFSIENNEYGGIKIIPNIQTGMVRCLNFDVMNMNGFKLEKDDIMYWINSYHDNYEFKHFNLYRKSLIKKMKSKKIVIKN